MNGLYFKAWDGKRYRTLAEILRSVEDHVRDLVWGGRVEEDAHEGVSSGVESSRPNDRISTWWDVETDSSEILGKIANWFPDAAPLPKAGQRGPGTGSQ
jgi:hypothetical protein